MGAGVYLEQNCDAVSTCVERTGAELPRGRGRGGAAGVVPGTAGTLLLEHHLDRAAHSIRPAALGGTCARQRAVLLQRGKLPASDAPGGAGAFRAAPLERGCRSGRCGNGCPDAHRGHPVSTREYPSGCYTKIFGQSSASRPPVCSSVCQQIYHDHFAGRNGGRFHTTDLLKRDVW